MTDTILALQQRLAESVARLEAIDANLARSRLRVAAGLKSRVSTLDEQTERRVAQSLEQLRTSVIDKVAVGRYGDLTSREGRAAVHMLTTLTPQQVAAILTSRPETWKHFAEGIFRNWDASLTLPSLDAYVGFFGHSPRELTFLHGGVPAATLASPGGPAAAARAYRRTTLVQTTEAFVSAGLRTRWAFTAHATAHASRLFMDESGLAAVWAELAAVPDLAATLLPAPAQARRSWFFANPPASSRGSTGARAMFVASALRALAEKGYLPSDAFATALLDSEFGDPRIAPESLGWTLVRQLAAQAYGAFLQQLVREDLALFFEHAMNEPARGRFWLDYIGAIRRTVCVLGASTYKELESRLVASTPAVKAALGRVRRFQAHKGVSAFCLYFDKHVIVEFSTIGNAAYVYSRDVFEAKIEPLVMANKLGAHDDLKRMSLVVTTIRHGKDWERATRDLLLRLSVRRAT